MDTEFLLVIPFFILISFSIALSISQHYIFFIISFATLFILTVFFYWIKRNRWSQNIDYSIFCEKSSRNKENRIIFLICFLIVFLFTSVYWLAYFPGGFNLDAYGQWLQAHGEQPYNDWHPITSTLIIKFVTLIYDSFSFYILLQILLFSLSISRLFSVLQTAGINSRILFILALFIGMSPSIGLNTINLTKDVQFTILIINLITCYISILFSNGEWLNSLFHILFLGCLSGLAMLVRHNGIFFVLPAFVLTLYHYRSHFFKILISILLSCFMIFTFRLVLFQLLDVEKHENIIGETVGIPMAILGNALITDPEGFPHEIHSFLNEIASDSAWQESYIVGEWDSCKWKFGGTDSLKAVSLSTILKYTHEIIKKYPQASYDSFKENTRIVLDPIHTLKYWMPEVSIESNQYNIKSTPFVFFNNICNKFILLSFFPGICILFWNTGFQLLMILFSFLLNRRSIHSECLLFFLPLLFYDLGTMIFLSGPNQRYFYCNTVLFLPLILAQLKYYEVKGYDINLPTENHRSE